MSSLWVSDRRAGSDCAQPRPVLPRIETAAHARILVRYRLIGFNHGRVEHNRTSIHRALVFLSPSLGSQSAVAYQQRDFMSHCALHVETVCLQLPTSPSRSRRVDCWSVCRGPRGKCTTRESARTVVILVVMLRSPGGLAKTESALPMYNAPPTQRYLVAS